MIRFKVSPKMAKYLKDHPYMEPHGLQEQQDEDDFDSEREPYYKESDFTPAQLSVLKILFDEQYDKIDMNSPEIRKAVYSLHEEDYIDIDTGIRDFGRIVLSDIYGGKYDFENYLFGGLNEKFSKEERKKRAKKCDNPKGFTMKQFCKNQKTRSKKGERKNESVEIEEKVLKRGDEYVYVDKKGKVRGRHKTRKAAEKQAKAIFISRNVGEGIEHGIEEKKKRDPKKGTGKKPKGSSRRLYTDENPKDTVSVKFSTVQDIKDTLSKSSFKSKSHKRQSQIINLIHQRVRAAYRNAKDPKVKKRLKKAYDYATKRKEASKRKTKRMQKENFQTDVKKKHKKMKIRLIGLGGGKNTPGTAKPSYKRSKSAPPGFGGSLEEAAPEK